MTTATVTRPARRTKKTAVSATAVTGPTASTGKKGRRKAQTTQGEAVRSPLEQAICDKYPDHNIEVGSLMLADAPGNPFPGKRVVSFICACGTSRILATSDLHHVHHCKVCIIDVRRTRRAAKAEKKAQ